MVEDPWRTKEYRGEDGERPTGVPTLEIVRGVSPRPPIQFETESVVIGRDPECEVSVLGEGVSRKHARVFIDKDGGLNLVDLGSRNGTHLNGKRVEMASLRHGDEIRLGAVVIRVRYLGIDAGSGAAVEPGRPPDLSKREFEVAQLVAEGLTNAEVGARLHISPATVSRHLANVYQRLGIKSRAALAKYISGPR